MRRLELAANQSLTSPIVALAGNVVKRLWMTSATVRLAASSTLVFGTVGTVAAPPGRGLAGRGGQRGRGQRR